MNENAWNDFNSAEDQGSFDLIPKNTLARVRMTIRPGGHDDFSQGWNGGYATQSDATGAVYLNCEFVVTDGPYAKRKIWSLIGLYSPKGPEWSNMGRAFIKGMLNSARGLHPSDNTPQAQQARRIQGFADIDGMEFVVKVETDRDQNGDEKNIVRTVITPDNKEYAGVMGQMGHQPQMGQMAQQPQQPMQQGFDQSQQVQQQNQQHQPSPTGRPSWAQ